MKYILAILITLYSTTIWAGSYIVGYDTATHSVTIIEDISVPGRWTRTTQLVDKDGNVGNTGKTFDELRNETTK